MTTTSSAAHTGRDSALRRMITRARPLAEVLAAGEQLDAASLRDWRTVVAREDDDLFTRRRAWEQPWDALTPSDDTMPAWAALFESVYGDGPDTLRAVFARMDPHDRARRSDAPLPFEELHLPFVVHARAAVAARTVRSGHMIEAAAMATLEYSLLRRLTTITRQAWQTHLAVNSSLAGLTGAIDMSAPAIHAAFIAAQRDGGLFGLYAEYPVSARLCARVTALWIEAVTELLERLYTDRDDLVALFGEGARGPASSLRCDLSDPHDGGRSVVVLEWTRGTRVVYKPRAVGMDADFCRLLEWLNARVSGLELWAPAVLPRNGYGWIAFVDHSACDAARIPTYFERCGALLAIAYALNGTDFHFENLMAAGENPVLLDLESLLGHGFDLGDDLGSVHMPGDGAQRAARQSVINVRMLPSVKVHRDGIAIETGAIGDFYRGHNLPLVNRQPIGGLAFGEAVLAGFVRAYRAIADGAAELTSPGGVLHAFGRHPVRFILRNTSLYLALLDRCHSPRFLRSGVARGIELDVLAKTFIRLESPPAIWAALEEEHRCLEENDVPLFAALATSRDLPMGDGRVARNCFRTSAYQEMLERVGGLNEADLERQVGLIRGAFRAGQAHDLCLTVSRSELSPSSGPLTPTVAIDEARRIADRLCAASVDAGSSRLAWLGMTYLHTVRRYSIGPMPHGVFDGYGGLALFLAAVARVTGDSAVAIAARRAAAPLIDRVADLERIVRIRRQHHGGIGCGVGSAVYLTAALGRCLADERLLMSSERIGRLLIHARGCGTGYDLLGGSGGAILALLAAHRATGQDSLAAGAAEYGRDLLRARVVDPVSGRRVWPNFAGGFDAGFAHGQAGIAAALYRLAGVVSDASFAEAGAEALAFERHRADVAAGESMDLERTAAWSRGQTGIAFARLEALSFAPGAQLRAEIDDALGASHAALLDGPDTMCCGAAARLELLDTASAQLQRPDLRIAALHGACALVSRARQDGYETGWGRVGPWQLGLFHGDAGVGYTLLRLTHPDLLPSPLQWMA